MLHDLSLSPPFRTPIRNSSAEQRTKEKDEREREEREREEREKEQERERDREKERERERATIRQLEQEVTQLRQELTDVEQAHDTMLQELLQEHTQAQNTLQTRVEELEERLQQQQQQRQSSLRLSRLEEYPNEDHDDVSDVFLAPSSIRSSRRGSVEFGAASSHATPPISPLSRAVDLLDKYSLYPSASGDESTLGVYSVRAAPLLQPSSLFDIKLNKFMRQSDLDSSIDSAVDMQSKLQYETQLFELKTQINNLKLCFKAFGDLTKQVREDPTTLLSPQDRRRFEFVLTHSARVSKHDKQLAQLQADNKLLKCRLSASETKRKTATSSSESTKMMQSTVQYLATALLAAERGEQVHIPDRIRQQLQRLKQP